MTTVHNYHSVWSMGDLTRLRWRSADPDLAAACWQSDREHFGRRRSSRARGIHTHPTG